MSKIVEPVLILDFLKDDLKPGHARGQVLTGNSIVKGSIAFHQQLLSGLKSSSNQVVLQLNKACPAIEDIIATEGDIKAVLQDGMHILFTGYLSTNYTWAITGTGERALTITLEDIGTRVLGRLFLDKGFHLFNCEASMVVASICARCGIVLSENCPHPGQVVTRTIDSSITCKDLLDSLVYELGYIYFFDNQGQLSLFKVDCTSTSGLPVLDKDKLLVVNGNAIALSKKIRTIQSSRVSFTRLGYATNYLIYRNTTGQGDGHPYCCLQLKGGHYFDGVEAFSPSAWEEETAEDLNTPTLIEAVNAESEAQVVGSNPIISISNVRSVFTAQSGSITCVIEEAGGPYIKIQAHNNGSLDSYITRMDVYADIVYEKDTNVVKAGESALAQSSENTLTEDLKWIHNVASATELANRIVEYNRYASSQYTFYSKTNIETGTIVQVFDNVFSGLHVAVLITSRVFTDQNDVIEYHGVGISPFDLRRKTTVQVISSGKGELKGPKGDDGENTISIQIFSTNGDTFRNGQCNTTLKVFVWQGDEDITVQIDDSKFTWERISTDPASDLSWNSSSKAIGKKTVSLTPEDVSGRTVFACHVDL